MPKTEVTRLAVLIDTENVPSKFVGAAFAEMATYGALSVRRAYGNWAALALGQWEKHLAPMAIQPVQQFGWVKGKNAADSALIIDAMDLLYAGRVDGFCLLSSDSDFTRLATRLRESGMTVYGLGERKTPESFVKACDRFVYLEVLAAPSSDSVAVPPPDLTSVETPDDAAEVPTFLEAVAPAIVSSQKESGWSQLATVGHAVRRTQASFDHRNYGFQTMRQAVNATPQIDVQEFDSPSGVIEVWVRLKKSSS